MEATGATETTELHGVTTEQIFSLQQGGLQKFLNIIEQEFNFLVTVIVRSRKPILVAVGIRCADHATPSIRKIWH
jgi:hypothetical protein